MEHSSSENLETGKLQRRLCSPKILFTRPIIVVLVLKIIGKIYSTTAELTCAECAVFVHCLSLPRSVYLIILPYYCIHMHSIKRM